MADILSRVLNVGASGGTGGGGSGTVTSVGSGAGLTGGPITTSGTLNIGANGDGSIVVNANDIQIGTLATDGQHGPRGGGALHANVIAAGASGFMTGADKTILDGLAATSVPSTRTLTAGTGLSGGGDLTADRIFDITATGVTAAAYGAADTVGTFNVNAEGQLIGAVDVLIQIAEAQVTGLTADLGTLTTAVASKANQSIVLTAGTGLMGGGDLSANRTFALANTAVTPTTYGGTGSDVGTFIVDAQGRITFAVNTPILIAESQVTNLVSDLASKADDSTVVHLAGVETITGVKTFSATPIVANAPTNPTDAANKAYVDAVAQGLNPKMSVKVVSTTNLSLTGFQSVDGYTLANNDRLVLTGQSTPAENGIWVAHAGAWTRPTDFATGSSAEGAYMLVELGTVNALSGWVCVTAAPNDIVDTNALSFSQFNGLTDVIAGAGLIKSGNTISIANAPFTPNAILFADGSGNITEDAPNLYYVPGSGSALKIDNSVDLITAGDFTATSGGTTNFISTAPMSFLSADTFSAVAQNAVGITSNGGLILISAGADTIIESSAVNGTALTVRTATTWTGGNLQLWQNGGGTQASMDYNGNFTAQFISANNKLHAEGADSATALATVTPQVTFRNTDNTNGAFVSTIYETRDSANTLIDVGAIAFKNFDNTATTNKSSLTLATANNGVLTEQFVLDDTGNVKLVGNLRDQSDVKSIDFNNRRAYASDGTTLRIDWSNPAKLTLGGPVDLRFDSSSTTFTTSPYQAAVRNVDPTLDNWSNLDFLGDPANNPLGRIGVSAFNKTIGNENGSMHFAVTDGSGGLADVINFNNSGVTLNGYLRTYDSSTGALNIQSGIAGSAILINAIGLSGVTYSIGIGGNANASNSIAIGYGSAVNSSPGSAFGYGATSSSIGTAVWGNGASDGGLLASWVAGSVAMPFNDVYFGQGSPQPSVVPTAWTLHGGGIPAGDTDGAGADLKLAGGIGTGTGSGGAIVLQVAPASGASGNTQNSLVNLATFSAANVSINGQTGYNAATPGVGTAISLQGGNGGASASANGGAGGGVTVGTGGGGSGATGGGSAGNYVIVGSAGGNATTSGNGGGGSSINAFAGAGGTTTSGNGGSGGGLSYGSGSGGDGDNTSGSGGTAGSILYQGSPGGSGFNGGSGGSIGFAAGNRGTSAGGSDGSTGNIVFSINGTGSSMQLFTTNYGAGEIALKPSGTVDLGTSADRWRDLYALHGSFNGQDTNTTLATLVPQLVLENDSIIDGNFIGTQYLGLDSVSNPIKYGFSGLQVIQHTTGNTNADYVVALGDSGLNQDEVLRISFLNAKFVVGSAAANIQDVWFGQGLGATGYTPAAWTLHGSDAVTGDTDIAGGDLHLAAGVSTGSGTGGNVVVGVGITGSTGSTQNAILDVAVFAENGVSYAVSMLDTFTGLASLNTNNRQLIASDGTTVQMGWSTAGTIAFSASGGTTLSNTTGDLTIDTDPGTAAQTAITLGHVAQSAAAIAGTRIAIQGGFGNASNGGAVAIKGGDGVGTDKNGGVINIDAGAPTGTGTALMLFGFANAKTMVYGNTATTHYFKGVHKIGNTGILSPGVARELEVPPKFPTTDDTDQVMWSYTPPVSVTYTIRAEINATDDGTGVAGSPGLLKWMLIRAKVRVTSGGSVSVKPLPGEFDDDLSTENWKARFTTNGTEIQLTVSGETNVNVQWSAEIKKQLNSYL